MAAWSSPRRYLWSNHTTLIAFLQSIDSAGVEYLCGGEDSCRFDFNKAAEMLGFRAGVPRLVRSKHANFVM
jgi:hypothetical protein